MNLCNISDKNSLLNKRHLDVDQQINHYDGQIKPKTNFLLFMYLVQRMFLLHAFLIFRNFLI